MGNNNDSKFIFERCQFPIIRLILIIYALFAVYHYTVWLVNPYPNELREGVSLHIVSLMSNGINPFSNESPSSFFYMYGFASSWVIAILNNIFGDHGFLLHRLFALLCLLASALLVECEARRLGRETFPQWMAFLLMLPAGWISHELISRPDNLALLLFVTSTFLLARWRHWLAPMLAAIFILVAFYTKQYFVLMTIPLFLGTLLLNLRNALIFGFVFSSLFFPSLFLVQSVYPNYFPMAILAFGGGSVDIFHLAKQLAAFVLFYWPLICIVFWHALQSYRETKLDWLGIRQWSGPVIQFNQRAGMQTDSPKSLSFYSMVFLVNFGLLLWLGTNSGAVMTYFYQLLLPPLIILFAAALGSNGFKCRFRKAILYLTCAFSMFHIFGFLAFTPTLSKRERADWADAEGIINTAGSAVQLQSTLFVKLALANNLECFNGGLFALDWLRLSLEKLKAKDSPYQFLFPTAPAVVQRCESFRVLCDRKLESRDFSLVVTERITPEMESRFESLGYSKSREMHLRTGSQIWPVQFWTLNDRNDDQ